MPSVSRSTHWFCRIDGDSDVLRQRAQAMLEWVDLVKVIGATHKGDKKENPHAHFCIQLASELQKQSFDVRFKKIFTPEAKSSWSTKVWDAADEAVSYLFHEVDATIIINNGHSESDIERYKLLNESVQRVVAINKSRGPARVVDKLVQEMAADYPSKINIFTRLVLMIRNGEMYEPGDFRLKAIVEEIYLKTRADEHIENYIYMRFNSMFRT